MGTYGFFIQADTSSAPTVVSVADLENVAPCNHQLIITGGRALVNDAVVYYETRRNGMVAGSEAHFIPIQDASPAAYPCIVPPLLLRISEAKMDAIKKGKVFDAGAIPGVRMTPWDLESNARNLLIKRYGEAAVKKIVDLKFENEITGMGGALGQMLLGAVCIAGVAVFAGLSQRPERENTATA